MFTGIIETQGVLREIKASARNIIMWIESSISRELKVDQSVAHNGVCLTVEEVNNDMHRVTAIQETLLKSTIEAWKIGERINIERCMPMNGRIDGHIVQGHVDTCGVCTSINQNEGSTEYRLRFPERFAHLVIEKGSICINGISLTAFNVGIKEVSVAIIPYTFHHTNMKDIREGDLLNIEFDVIGKYIQRWQQVQSTIANRDTGISHDI
ncbi:MAG TPA: riboflavin synthase [Flavitalea sp.]|nr:riboflavin synthase [Flavitalea sp.]